MIAIRTLAELRATCSKAARGAGCSWGMAEEAGLAVRVLEAHGLPGASVLAEVLSTPRSCGCSKTKDAPICGLSEMARLSDALPDYAPPNGAIVGPLLLVAPLVLEAGSGRCWRIEWPGGSAACGPDGVVLSGGAAPLIADWVKLHSAGLPESPTPPRWFSRPVAADALARLETFAARTYVPETAASRSSGAGPST